MNGNERVLSCIGFIMDGNRRWAEERGLEGHEGHIHGAEVFEHTIRFLRDNHVPHAIFYAFSSENWNRSKAELTVFRDLLKKELTKLHEKLNGEDENEKRVRFRFAGDVAKFGVELKEKIDEIEAESKKYTDTTIWIALSYGGRDEIVNAVNRAVEKGEKVDEASFQALLSTKDMPDPDIIVRTGGQKRLSNFLPWQSVYSEFLFLDKYWPDITNGDLEKVIADYKDRTRNFGV